MSEHAEQPRPSAGEESPRAGSAEDAGGRGSVRTAGETSVDEAMGAGDEPTR